MGILDRIRSVFGGGSSESGGLTASSGGDPVDRLMSMNSEELRRFEAKIETKLDENFSRMDQLKDEYADLLMKADGVDELRRKRIESDLKEIRQRMSLRKKDILGAMKMKSLAGVVRRVAEGTGQQTAEMGSQLKSLMGMEPNEFGQALRQIGEENEAVREEADLFDSMLDDFTESTSIESEVPDPESVGIDADPLSEIEPAGEAEAPAAPEAEADDDRELELQ